MNDIGWSRREQPANTQPQNPLLGTLSRFNPFGGDSYVHLPTTEGEAPGAPLPARTRREEEEGWFARKSETPSAYKVSAVACAASNTNLPRLHYESLRGGSLGRIAYGLQEHLLRAQVYCRSPALVCNAGHHCIASASHGQSQ